MVVNNVGCAGQSRHSNRANVHPACALDLSDQQKTASVHLFAAVGSKFGHIQIDELRDDVDHLFM